jgi:hypothetical protein
MCTKISIAAITVIAAVFAAQGISNAKTQMRASRSYRHHRVVGSAYGFAPTYEHRPHIFGQANGFVPSRMPQFPSSDLYQSYSQGHQSYPNPDRELYLPD